MKFQLVRSARKQIDTSFGCIALSFQLISIVSLLNLSSCDSNILKVNISDVYEREVRNRESNDHTICRISKRSLIRFSVFSSFIREAQ